MWTESFGNVDDIFSPYEDIQKLSNKFKTKILYGAGHIFFNINLWNEILDIIIEYRKEDKRNR